MPNTSWSASLQRIWCHTFGWQTYVASRSSAAHSAPCCPRYQTSCLQGQACSNRCGIPRAQLAQDRGTELFCLLHRKQIKCWASVTAGIRLQVSASAWDACAQTTLQTLPAFSPAIRHPLLTAGPSSAPALMAGLAGMRAGLASGQHQVTQLPRWEFGIWPQSVSVSPTGRCILVERPGVLQLYKAPGGFGARELLLDLSWRELPGLILADPHNRDLSEQWGRGKTLWAPNSLCAVLVLRALSSHPMAGSSTAYVMDATRRTAKLLSDSLTPKGDLRLAFSPCSTLLAVLKPMRGEPVCALVYCCNTWAVTAAWSCFDTLKVTGLPAFSRDASSLAVPQGQHVRIYSTAGLLLHDLCVHVSYSLDEIVWGSSLGGNGVLTGSLPLLAAVADDDVQSNAHVSDSAVTWGATFKQLAILTFLEGSHEHELHIWTSGSFPPPVRVGPAWGNIFFSEIFVVQNASLVRWGAMQPDLLGSFMLLGTGSPDQRGGAVFSQACQALCLSPDSRFAAFIGDSRCDPTEAKKLRVVDMITGVTVLHTVLQAAWDPVRDDQIAEHWQRYTMRWSDCCRSIFVDAF